MTNGEESRQTTCYLVRANMSCKALSLTQVIDTSLLETLSFTISEAGLVETVKSYSNMASAELEALGL